MLRNFAKLTVVASILASQAAAQGPAPASKESAGDIVRKAIVAHGGADLLNKYPAAKVKSKGCINLRGQTIQFTSLTTYQMPDRLKEVQTLITPVGNRTLTLIQVGDKVRMFMDKQEVPVAEAELPRYRQMIFVQNCYRLTPLLDEKLLKTGLADDTLVCDRPARGVKITADGRKDVIFYFDKGTGMLVKAFRMTADPLGGGDAPLEEIFINYKDVKGFLYPTKTQVLLRGQKYIESEVVEFLPLEKFDPSEFEKP